MIGLIIAKQYIQKLKKKVTITCRKHNTDFEQQAKLHISSVRSYDPCPKCKAEGFSLSLDEFVRRSREIHGDKYDYSKSKEGYKDTRSKIIITCREHGDFVQLVNTHLNGHGCPKCGYNSAAVKSKTSIIDFIKRANEVHGLGKYDYSKITELDRLTDKVTIHCNICDSDFEQSAVDHLRGSGCTKCKLSSGEQMVSMYLINKGIDINGYTRLFSVSSVRLYVVPDFLFSLNNNEYWIEYQGEQHYKYLPWFHDTMDKFNIQIQRDLEVREYCKTNNIKLIEIPFILNTYSKISEFLDKVLYEEIDPWTIIDYNSLYDLEDLSSDNNST